MLQPIAALLIGVSCAVALSVGELSVGEHPRTVSVNDPELATLWQAARAFDRKRFGFSPLPNDGSVGLERPTGRKYNVKYDVMLHLGPTSPTIAFRKATKGYRWIGEQETFRGLHTYESIDGKQLEKLILTYDLEEVSGAPVGKLIIFYYGTDKRLEGAFRNLTLREVKPVLREWGY